VNVAGVKPEFLCLRPAGGRSLQDGANPLSNVGWELYAVRRDRFAVISRQWNDSRAQPRQPERVGLGVEDGLIVRARLKSFRVRIASALLAQLWTAFWV
jgi:hypothetical protein